jgi:methyl-accepting chemotaxis protein
MQNWKISQRLMAGFGLVIAMLLGMSVYSVYIARGIDAALTANATQNAVIQRAAINFRGSAHDRSIAVRDVVLAPNEAARQREIEAIDRLAAFYAASGQQMDKVLQSGGSVPPEVAPMVQAIRDIEARTVATTRKVVALVQAGDRTAAEALLWSDAKPQYEQWLAAINKLIDFEEARIIKNSTQANQEASQFSKVMLAITALALLVGVTATVLVSRSIGRELGAEPREVRSVVQAMQQGNLTVAVPVGPGDSSSVMVAVRDMQQRFHELVSAVRDNIDELHATSSAIANGNQHLGQRTEQAASSLEQTAASMEELTATVRQSADSAQAANRLAAQAAGTASRGGEVMQQVVSTMAGHQRTAATRSADIIGVIDGIAFQTNILALECRCRSRPCGRAGPGLCRGGQRGAQPGTGAVQKPPRRSRRLIQAQSVEKVESGTSAGGQCRRHHGPRSLQSVQRVT